MPPRVISQTYENIYKGTDGQTYSGSVQIMRINEILKTISSIFQKTLEIYIKVHLKYLKRKVSFNDRPRITKKQEIFMNKQYSEK